MGAEFSGIESNRPFDREGFVRLHITSVQKERKGGHGTETATGACNASASAGRAEQHHSQPHDGCTRHTCVYDETGLVRRIEFVIDFVEPLYRGHEALNKRVQEMAYHLNIISSDTEVVLALTAHREYDIMYITFHSADRGKAEEATFHSADRGRVEEAARQCGVAIDAILGKMQAEDDRSLP